MIDPTKAIKTSFAAYERENLCPPGKMVVGYEAARLIYQHLPEPRHSTDAGFIAALEMGEVVLANGTVVEAAWL